MIRRSRYIGSVFAAAGLVAVASSHAQQAPIHIDANNPAKYDPNAILSLTSKNHPSGGTILQPSVITIHAHDLPLADVLADLANQSGADLAILGSTEINDSHMKKVTLDLDKGSFWDAMIPLSKAGGIGPFPGAGQQRMVIVDRPTGLGSGADLAAQASGMLLIPQFAHVERLVNYDDRSSDRSALSVQILLIPEPKMQIVGGDFDNWLDSCVDDKGNSLASDVAKSSTGQVTQSWVTLLANLVDVPQQGSRIASIKGKVKLNIRTQSQVLTLSDIMKNKAPQVAGKNSIQITSASSDPDMDTLKVSFVQEGATNMPGLGQSPPIPEGITFYDQAGLIVPYKFANAGGSGMGVTVTYGFITGPLPTARHPVSMRWELTTASQSVQVPFELHNLDLPIARQKPAN